MGLKVYASWSWIGYNPDFNFFNKFSVNESHQISCMQVYSGKGFVFCSANKTDWIKCLNKKGF